MNDTPVEDFTLRRIDPWAQVVRVCGAGLLSYHRVVAEGVENLPQEGAGLLLPKHHAYRDILVEGVSLYKYTSRFATFVMKRGLWRILELSGGVKVTRPKDVRRLKDREQRRAAIQRAREANQEMQAYLSWLYRNGELVISHPEGMRYKDHMGPLQKEIVEHLLQTQETWEIQVPMIPIGIEYESYAIPGSRAYFRVGEPIWAQALSDLPEVVDALDEQLRRLSGLD